jgi:proteasome lid subunit RPN8/RPN11
VSLSTIRGVGEASNRHRSTRFLLDPSVREQLIEHMKASLPAEGVGLLGGTWTTQGPIGRWFYGGRNIDAAATRYTMDPVDVAASMREFKRRGAEFTAVVHSHPCTPPTPSRTDLNEARRPWSLHVIVGFQPAPEIRAWRFEFDRFGRADDYRELTIGLLAGETIANEPDSGAADAGTVRQWEQVKEWQWKHWRLRRAAGGWSKSA